MNKRTAIVNKRTAIVNIKEHDTTYVAYCFTKLHEMARNIAEYRLNSTCQDIEITVAYTLPLTH